MINGVHELFYSALLCFTLLTQVINGVHENAALRTLKLDNNGLAFISNLGDLPLHHLSVANNHISVLHFFFPNLGDLPLHLSIANKHL
jgi:hypothetical protein